MMFFIIVKRKVFEYFDTLPNVYKRSKISAGTVMLYCLLLGLGTYLSNLRHMCAVHPSTIFSGET